MTTRFDRESRVGRDRRFIQAFSDHSYLIAMRAASFFCDVCSDYEKRRKKSSAPKDQKARDYNLTLTIVFAPPLEEAGLIRGSGAWMDPYEPTGRGLEIYHRRKSK